MQIPAFWRTFSQKINCRKSAKYHTFPFQALLHAPRLKMGQLAPSLDYDGMWDRGARKWDVLAKTGLAATLKQTCFMKDTSHTNQSLGYLQ